ncbi:hypothetical protein ACIQGZ_28425 [Streptomyces sp. NPDC092296]|uniref:hypothetical protein n=1 Tax=Streptomyces sp. NPDC092296 TaxID=3366012 RepID=UPI0038210C73
MSSPTSPPSLPSPPRADQAAVPPVRAPQPPGGVHQVAVSESGSFCTARCGCGWYAPARRSRDRARRDAAEHAPS